MCREWLNEYPSFFFLDAHQLYRHSICESKPLNQTANLIEECIGASEFDGVHVGTLLGHEMLCICNICRMLSSLVDVIDCGPCYLFFLVYVVHRALPFSRSSLGS